MASYSPITSFRIRNFMSITDATLHFDDTGVINLKGFNDSGKSVVLRALEVCLANRYPSKQSKFIQDDKPGFSIQVNFADGVSIVREKYSNGKSLYEMFSSGERVFSTKRGSDLGKVDGVPEEIATYLGLCQTEEGVLLNSRAVQDPKLLVETSGSENFKSLHSVLKVDELVRAISAINVDRNSVQGEISSLEGLINAEENMITGMLEILPEDIEGISAANQELDSAQRTHQGMERLQSFAQGVHEADLNAIPDLQGLHLQQANSLGVLSSAAHHLNETPSLPDLGEIEELQSVHRLESLLSTWCTLSEMEELPSLEEVGNLSELSALLNLQEAFTLVAQRTREVQELDPQESALVSELDELHQRLHSSGLSLYTCTFCSRPQIISEKDILNG